jgi:hypothetical protein
MFNRQTAVEVVLNCNHSQLKHNNLKKVNYENICNITQGEHDLKKQEPKSHISLQKVKFFIENLLLH